MEKKDEAKQHDHRRTDPPAIDPTPLDDVQERAWIDHEQLLAQTQGRPR